MLTAAVFIVMGNVVMLSTVSQLLKCFAMIFMLNAVMLSVMASAQYDDIQLNGTQLNFKMTLLQIPYRQRHNILF
jgi:energy-converting hydrogenase Eha subunit C